MKTVSKSRAFGSVQGVYITLPIKKRSLKEPVLIDRSTANQFLDLPRPKAMLDLRLDGLFHIENSYDYFFIWAFLEAHAAFRTATLHA